MEAVEGIVGVLGAAISASNRSRPAGKVVEELEERILGHRVEEVLARDEPREPLLDDLEERVEGLKSCILVCLRHGAPEVQAPPRSTISPVNMLVTTE